MKGCVRYRIPDIMEAKDKYYYIPTENARPPRTLGIHTDTD